MIQTVECASCGRVAAVYCAHCRKGDPHDLPFELIEDRVQDIILRWCGGRSQEIVQNVIYALQMERRRLAEARPAGGRIET